MSRNRHHSQLIHSSPLPLVAAALLLAACPAPAYTVGGTVTGLAGAGPVLQNNGCDDLAVTANGTFAFATRMASGSSYSVTVKTHLASQTCVVTNGTGTIAGSNITGVAVTCTTITYSVSGTVSGLFGTGLVLQNNAADDLSVSAGGNFTFPTRIPWGSACSVTVKTQPTSPSQICVVTNGAGTVGGADVINIVVSCARLWSSAIAGGNHTAGIMTDGTLWAWGHNSDGQLGDGTTTNKFSPVQVGSGFASVTAGAHHTMAVKTDGTLWVWGNNNNGQLGDGTTSRRTSPVQVGSGFASVAAGGFHTMAVKTDGTLWAWGANRDGQLGDSASAPNYLPVPVP